MIFDKFKFWKKDVMTFYCHPDLVGVIPEPKPATKSLPDWFKNLPQQIKDDSVAPRDVFGNYAMTAKMCLPLLDGMSLGYTIPLAGDLRIKTNHNNNQIEATHGQGLKLIDYHNSQQVGGDNTIVRQHGNILKFLNYWLIKTAPGWSTLFVPTLNHFQNPFTPLSAIVDTDVYNREVHFPVIWNIPNADMTLPSGTPMVTAIPFKRNSFPKKPTIRKMTNKEIREYDLTSKIQDVRSHYYTYELRHKR